MRKVILVLSLLASTSCGGVVGAHHMTGVPKDSPVTCARFCTDMGMTLASVVIMADRVGCVCNPGKGTDATASSAAGSVAGAGMAAVLIQEQQAQQSRGGK